MVPSSNRSIAIRRRRDSNSSCSVRAGDSLPNVGAILRADAFRRRNTVATRPWRPLQERLQQALEKARQPARRQFLYRPHAGELALLKPFGCSEDRRDARLARCCAELSTWPAIWPSSLFWWARGIRGDYHCSSRPPADGHRVCRPAEPAGSAARYAVVRPLHARRQHRLDICRSVGPGFPQGRVPRSVMRHWPRRSSCRVMLIVFGGGPGGSNAKVNFGPVQPIEAIRLLLALFLAGYFARRWELLRQVRARTFRDVRVPGWLNLPKLDYVLPVLAGVAARSLFFFLQKDLGPALFISCVFLLIRHGQKPAGLAIFGLSVLVAGFYIGYKLNISTTLAARVQIWQSPLGQRRRGGDQIAQAIWALSTGGLFGTGLGLGDARYLPAGHTDLVLAAIGEELGFVGLLCVAASSSSSRRAASMPPAAHGNDYGFFLATAVTLFLALPVLVMTARHARRRAADGRRHSVPELRRLGNGRQLRGTRHAHSHSESVHRRRARPFRLRRGYGGPP